MLEKIRLYGEDEEALEEAKREFEDEFGQSIEYELEIDPNVDYKRIELVREELGESLDHEGDNFEVALSYLDPELDESTRNLT